MDGWIYSDGGFCFSLLWYCTNRQIQKQFARTGTTPFHTIYTIQAGFFLHTAMVLPLLLWFPWFPPARTTDRFHQNFCSPLDVTKDRLVCELVFLDLMTLSSHGTRFEPDLERVCQAVVVQTITNLNSTCPFLVLLPSNSDVRPALYTPFERTNRFIIITTALFIPAILLTCRSNYVR